MDIPLARKTSRRLNGIFVPGWERREAGKGQGMSASSEGDIIPGHGTHGTARFAGWNKPQFLEDE